MILLGGIAFCGNGYTEVESLRGKRAFDFALSDSGTLFVAGDEEDRSTGNWSVLSARIDGEWETVIRHHETLFFGSVATNGADVFGLDLKYIWRGTCP